MIGEVWERVSSSLIFLASNERCVIALEHRLFGVVEKQTLETERERERER